MVTPEEAQLITADTTDATTGTIPPDPTTDPNTPRGTPEPPPEPEPDPADVINHDQIYLPDDIIRDVFQADLNSFEFETTEITLLNLHVLDSEQNGVQSIVSLYDDYGTMLYRGATDEDGLLNDEISTAISEGRTTMVITVNGEETRTIVINNMGVLLKLDRTIYTPYPVTSTKDTDGDGILNVLDAFPDDPNKAFVVEYPPNERYTVTFEDLYPKLGDADFNDFIAAFTVTEIRNAQNKIVEITGEAEAIAKLAGYNHDLNIRIAGLADGTADIIYFNHLDEVKSETQVVSGIDYIDLPIFVSSADSFTKVTEDPETGEPIDPYKAGHKTTFTVVLATPIASGMVDAPPYDPYIYVRNTGENIHLAGKGTYEEGSPTYIEESTFIPWGLMIPIDWNYPHDRADIRDAFPQFQTWIDSDGMDAIDWYNHPDPELTVTIY